MTIVGDQLSTECPRDIERVAAQRASGKQPQKAIFVFAPSSSPVRQITLTLSTGAMFRATPARELPVAKKERVPDFPAPRTLEPPMLPSSTRHLGETHVTDERARTKADDDDANGSYREVVVSQARADV
jgi:hypothetical protein